GGLRGAPPVSFDPQPHTVRPKGTSLFISWRPLLHCACASKLWRDRSTRVYSYCPPLPSGCQSWSFPRQSSETSWKPSFCFERTTTRFVSGYVGSVKKT